jgi:hypothetical protein
MLQQSWSVDGISTTLGQRAAYGKARCPALGGWRPTSRQNVSFVNIGDKGNDNINYTVGWSHLDPFNAISRYLCVLWLTINCLCSKTSFVVNLALSHDRLPLASIIFMF